MMDLFAKVQMRGKRVLKHMNNQITNEYEHWRGFRKSHALRKHLQEDRTQHEAGTQRDEVPQGVPRPFVRDNNETADDVGQRRSKGEGYGLFKRRHLYFLR